MANKYLIV